MARTATRANENAVSRAYDEALAILHAGGELGAELRILYGIEHLFQEANSGGSFDQFFRWADVDEIAAVVGQLEALGLVEVAAIAREAIVVAFPDGIPANDDAQSEATDAWSPAQEDALTSLFERLEEHNAHVTNTLGAHALRHKLVPARRRAVAQPLPAVRSQLDEDREFYDGLGVERPGTSCQAPGCDRGAVASSTLCRVHHFEQLWRRPSPFSH
jgi:hypothetical protein